VVYFDEGLDRRTVLRGFTIRGGAADPQSVLPPGHRPELRPDIALANDFYADGAGIMVYGSAPVIENNRITENRAAGCGGGISVFSLQGGSLLSPRRWKKVLAPGPGPLIVGNVISANEARLTGGGIDVYYWARAEALNNVIEKNSAGRAGGAIAVLGRAAAELHGNTIVANRAPVYGSGLALKETRLVRVTNTIFAHNRGSGVIVSRDGRIAVEHSCFFDNDGDYAPPAGAGNLAEDPLFVEGPRGAYYLGQVAAGQERESPCVDAGLRSRHDAQLAGLTTRTDGVADGGAPDLGFHYPR
jgi:hypothetical protein